MISTEQTIVIDAPIARVWEFACDIRAWAKLMPGLSDCEVVDADHSRWSLKVGAGGLLRTVKLTVTVERWAGPAEVDFSYALDGDPVKGVGTYRALPLGPHATQIDLAVRVEGTGSMAPMWEAMGRPLLPKLARGFTEQFKAEVEQIMVTATAAPEGALPRNGFGFLRILQQIFKRFYRHTGTAG